MELLISQLIEYAVRKKWIEDSDRIWASNRILEALHMDGFNGLIDIEGELPEIRDILDGLLKAILQLTAIFSTQSSWDS